MIAHGVVLGIIIFFSDKLTSSRIQEKQVDISKAFTLISSDSYQAQTVSSSKPESFCKHTVAPESIKPEKPAGTVNSDVVRQFESVDSVSDDSNKNPQIDSILNVNGSIAGQNGTVKDVAKTQDAGEKETIDYIDEKKIIGGLKAVFKPPVPYPQVAQDQEIEGNVDVEFIVSKQGTVEEVSIIRATHPVFVNAVQRVVKSWCFKPVIVGGVSMRIRTVQRIEFRLE